MLYYALRSAPCSARVSILLKISNLTGVLWKLYAGRRAAVSASTRHMHALHCVLRSTARRRRQAVKTFGPSNERGLFVWRRDGATEHILAGARPARFQEIEQSKGQSLKKFVSTTAYVLVLRRTEHTACCFLTLDTSSYLRGALRRHQVISRQIQVDCGVRSTEASNMSSRLRRVRTVARTAETL